MATRVYAIRCKRTGQIIARYTDDEPDAWDDDLGLFHKNESTWCASNALWNDARVEVLDQHSWDSYRAEYPNTLDTGCPCMDWELELWPQS